MGLLEKTIKVLEDEHTHWARKAIVIHIYHTAKCLEHKRWTYADTGRDLHLSKAYISEAIKLTLAMISNSGLIQFSRKRALDKVRDIHV